MCVCVYAGQLPRAGVDRGDDEGCWKAAHSHYLLAPLRVEARDDTLTQPLKGLLPRFKSSLIPK